MKFLNYLLVLLLLLGCVDPYQTTIKKLSDRLVVEGGITNQAPPYSVTLTTSANFSQGIDGITRYVKGASIKVCDDMGQCIPYEEVKAGRYQTSASAPVGIIGRYYHLEILTADGKTIFSKPEKMSVAPPITKVYYEFDKATVVRNGFKILVDTKDPEEDRNYYKWETVAYTQYSLHCFTRIAERSIELIESDRNRNGNTISRVEVRTIPYSGTGYYVVDVFQLALSAAAFEFYDGIKKQINSTGSIFDPPPSFLRGNMYNPNDDDDIVLGYFYAAGATKSDIVVDRSSSIVGAYPSPFSENLVPEPVYCGDPCNFLCVSFGGGQCGVAPCPPECHYLPNITSIAPKAWPLPHSPCGD